jgi:hypothetical protein
MQLSLQDGTVFFDRGELVENNKPVAFLNTNGWNQQRTLAFDLRIFSHQEKRFILR